MSKDLDLFSDGGTVPGGGPVELWSAEAFDALTDALLVLDGGGRVLRANRAAEALLGAYRGGLLGVDAGRLLPLSAPLLGFLVGPGRGGPLELQVDIARLRGGTVRASVTAVRLEAGSVLLVCRPVPELGATAERERRVDRPTSRVEALEAAPLAPLEDVAPGPSGAGSVWWQGDVLGSLFGGLREGVMLIAADRTAVRMNRAAARLLGLSVPAVRMSELLGGLHPDDVEGFSEVLDLLEAQEGATENVRCRLLKGEGVVEWLEGSVTNLLGDEQVGAFVMTFREAHEQVEALDRIQSLNDELRRRLAHLQSLRRVDMAINNYVELQLVLDILLAQLIEDLGVDAAAVLIFEEDEGSLRPLVGRGFGGPLALSTSVGLGEGLAGRAGEEQRSVFVSDFGADGEWGLAVAAEWQSAFGSYMAVPMVAKGRLRGVIELFSRGELRVSGEWLEFQETYADQGAIAIENSQLLESLEESNAELQQAYDSTIEGWAAALDLKDEETAGHSKRVTDMTVRLARSLGVPAGELVHVQRGALLHDIGKMGIPDHVLLKPGKLSENEFELMQQHPRLAYELLWPIEFLRPALPIPLSHHERWDGSGYPDGLAGEDIPLVARIFAVVDVFDALTSERPYRGAWPVERALDHIREGSGSHFDPAVVDAFFAMMSQEDQAEQVGQAERANQAEQENQAERTDEAVPAEPAEQAGQAEEVEREEPGSAGE